MSSTERSTTIDHRDRDAATSRVFESLFIDMLPRARRSARFFAGEQADADDLLQEAALLAFSRFAQFERGTNFGAWFIRILTNSFYMKCRRERRSGTVSFERVPARDLVSGTDRPRAQWSAPLPNEDYVTRRETEDVVRAISALPDRFRDVAELYLLHDLTYTEIASTLGCPIGTVRSRLHRARKVLQEHLWPLAEDHGLVGPVERRGGPHPASHEPHSASNAGGPPRGTAEPLTPGRHWMPGTRVAFPH